MTDGRELYVIVMRDTAFWVVGPFEDEWAMRKWGDWERENGDDPRWQSIRLVPGKITATTVGPRWHPGYTP